MKILFIILGSLSLLLGILGIVVPLLPTTPFLLLTALLFAHSSPRLHAWLMSHKVFGEYIRNYSEKRTIPISLKITIIVILWAKILLSIFTVAQHTLWINIVLLVIAVAVTWHIVTLGNSKRPSDDE